MAAEDLTALDHLRRPTARQAETANVRAAMSWADEHLFARRSVVNDYKLKSAALTRGRGDNFDLSALNHAIRERDYCHPRHEVRKLASQNADCEGEIIRAAAPSLTAAALTVIHSPPCLSRQYPFFD